MRIRAAAATCVSAAPWEDLLAPAVEMLHCPTLPSGEDDGRGGGMDGLWGRKLGDVDAGEEGVRRTVVEWEGEKVC